MVKRVTITPDLDPEALYWLYRSSSNGTSRSHYQIIWLIRSAKTVTEVSQITGYSCNWIDQLRRRDNQLGVEALIDQRKDNRGQNSLLTDLEQAQLWQVLSQPAPDGGLCHGRKVADWLCQLTGKKISRHRGGEI